MSARWSKVADEIDAMRTIGRRRAGAASGNGNGPLIIETTHRVVPPKQLPAVSPAQTPPDRPSEEYRFRENGRLVKSDKGESFLTQGRKSRSWA